MKKVSLSRHRYSLDWFTVDQVEVSLDACWHYEMQFRLGCWYLMHRQYDKSQEKWLNRSELDFRLDDPVDAVMKLGERIYRFSKLHNSILSKEVSDLMKRVSARSEAS
ncbi:hypothetical protein AAHD62_22020 [Enterobacter hormaechei]